jgi:O-antigen ligase
LSGALSLLAPFVIARALDRRSSGLKSERLLLFALVLLMFVSGSRAGMLALIVGGGVYAWGTGRVKSGTIGGAAILFGVLAIIWPSISPMIEDVPLLRRFAVDSEPQEVLVYEDEEGAMEFSGSGREVAWPLAIRLIKQRALLGWGWGAEERLLERFREQVLSHQGFTFHNSYLSLLVHTGWVGALPIFALILRLLWRGLRCAARIRGPAAQAGPVPILVATFTGAVVYSVFESVLFASGNSSAPVIWLTGFSCGIIEAFVPEPQDAGA